MSPVNAQVGPGSGRLAGFMIGLFAAQLIAGLVNLVLLAPVWMQIVHLLLADVVWITLVLFAAVIFARQPANQTSLIDVTEKQLNTAYG